MDTYGPLGTSKGETSFWLPRGYNRPLVGPSPHSAPVVLFECVIFTSFMGSVSICLSVGGGGSFPLCLGRGQVSGYGVPSVTGDSVAKEESQ